MLNFIAKAQRVLEISCGNESVTDRQKDGRTDGRTDKPKLISPTFQAGDNKNRGKVVKSSRGKAYDYQCQMS